MLRTVFSKMVLCRKMNAYFTVEATMIVTLVTGVIVLLIYIMLFQYDRCLSDQDMGALALKGCSLQATTKEKLLQKLESSAAGIETGKYIAWERSNMTITLKENKVRVEQVGKLYFPFIGFSPGNAGRVWESKSVFENRRISPVNFLRSYRKTVGGK